MADLDLEEFVVDYQENRFKDTHLLQPAANYYRKHGVYTHHTKGTKKYYDFWDEEKRRCLEGFKAENGIHITGYHYFYLNYFRIDRAVEFERNGRKVKKREYEFPDFYDVDYDYFWTVEIARYGISEKKYKALNLDIDIHPDDLSGEKQLTVLKARRKGYSYKSASMLCRNYFHMPRSKNFVFAFDKKYLEGDGIYQKFLDGVSYVNDNTAWSQPTLVDRPAQMYMKSGYKVIENGKEIPKGFQSMVQGISLKDNPDGARGKAGELIFFEEMGKFPGLKKAWDITHHTVKEGTDALGIMVAFGTGGTEGADFAGAEQLFYSPESNDCIRINNKWDDGANGTYAGFFVPIYTNLRGFIDEFGNSRVYDAIEYETKQRAKKKADGNSDTYSQYVAETPFMPREAILTFDLNIFPTYEIAAQKNSVLANKRHTFGTAGMLYEDAEGKIKFDQSVDVKPVWKFPHSKQDDVTGAHVIYEAPVRINGHVPKDLYIACHDPFAQDTTTTGISLGATYIIKRVNDFSPTMNNCIVASYVGRPKSQDEYNRNMFLLAEYYNAKIGFENDRGDVIGYARRYKKLHMLEEQFSFLDKKELQGNTKRAFGMNMTNARKEQGEIYIRDWLLTPIQVYEDGSKQLVLHTIVDPALLEELLKFNKDGNFDRCLTKGTKLWTNNGEKNIEDIKINDLILTHKNQFKKVTKKTFNIHKDFSEIGIVGQPNTLKCTNDHPVYVCSHMKKRSGNRHWKFNHSPYFKKAEDLIPYKDFTLVPKEKNIPDIPLTKEEQYLIGWYIGDGYVKNNSFSIVFGKDEQFIAKKIAKIINKIHKEKDSPYYNTKETCTIKEHDGYYRLTKTSKYLSSLFKKYGGTPNNKKYKLYSWESIIGLIEAEGHIKTGIRTAIEISMKDEPIIKRLRQNLINYGVWSTYRVTKRGLHKLTISGEGVEKIINSLTLDYNIKKRSNRNVAISTEEGFWTPVKNINSFEKEQIVYNCEVEDDHTYVSNGIVTHNCMAIMIGMYHLKEKFNKKVKEIKDNKHEEFFNRLYQQVG